MTLYVVATPIGQWEDITLRALHILKSTRVIACEDTRETKKLLDHFDIDTQEKKLMSYHAQSSQGREDAILELLQSGESIALVSDRGTPGISDPGSRLIRRAIDVGIAVIPIPGASGVITALQAAGVDTHRFEFLGFVPHKKGRQTMMEHIMNAKHTICIYESPHRLLKTLEALKECSKQVVVCRELTKIHEEFVRGTGKEVYTHFTQVHPDTVRGECIIIVDAA